MSRTRPRPLRAGPGPNSCRCDAPLILTSGRDASSPWKAEGVPVSLQARSASECICSLDPKTDALAGALGFLIGSPLKREASRMSDRHEDGDFSQPRQYHEMPLDRPRRSLPDSGHSCRRRPAGCLPRAAARGSSLGLLVYQFPAVPGCPGRACPKPEGAAAYSPGRQPREPGTMHHKPSWKPRRGDTGLCPVDLLSPLRGFGGRGSRRGSGSRG